MCLCVRACGYLEVGVANTEHSGAEEPRRRGAPAEAPVAAAAAAAAAIAPDGHRRDARMTFYPGLAPLPQGKLPRLENPSNLHYRCCLPRKRFVLRPSCSPPKYGAQFFFRRSAVAPPTVMAGHGHPHLLPDVN